MPGSQRIQTTLTRISAALARPINDKETINTIATLVNALQGEWGYGAWDGGVDGEGYWNKNGAFWSCQMVFTATGSHAISLPFRGLQCLVESVVIGGGQSLIYVEDSDTVTITANGKTLVRVVNAQIGE